MALTINASEARDDDETYQSPVDILFQQLKEKEPDHFAVKQYRKFKMAAGDVCSKGLLNYVFLSWLVKQSLRAFSFQPMKTINLRWIYPHYRHDEFVEVSDEVWEAMRQAQREMNNYERRKVYHRAWYSLDAYSWAENYALEHGRSPEEILLEREERAAHLRLIAALPEALANATPT